MIKVFKSLFGEEKEEEYIPDSPGRTFNKILTGKYFGCEDLNADEKRVSKAKQKKIDQIRELELIPMYIRYFYEDTGHKEIQATEYHPITKASSVHVVFQKEVSAQRGQMTHVSEISFIIHRSDFNEFEKMSGLSLSNDFRDLTVYKSSVPYTGEDRRKVARER